MAVKKDPRLVELLDGRGPGAHLRKVREEANMSVGKIASALMLHPHTVEALEADAYERLPAPTFVRGYLRGYARVLGLPSRPILEMFDRQGFEPPPLTPDVTQSQQAHTSDTAVRLVTYAVAVVLVVLVALWWHSQEDGGFGISGDLFDRSPESDRDPALEADEETGMATIGGEDDSEIIDTPSDGTDASQPEVEPSAAPSVASAEDSAIATESIDPNGSSRGEEPTVTAGTGGSAPGDPASADSAASDETGATAPSVLSRNDEPAVTAPVEESAPDRMETVVPTPTEANTTGVTEIREASAADDLVVAENRETSTTRESSADSGSTAGAGPDTATSTGDTDGDDARAPDESAHANATDVSAGTSLAAVPEPDSTGAPRDSNVALTANPETTRSRLVLEFTHESWVEVYDRERARLFFGLVQPGRVLSFDGMRPFDVLLGFGNDVRVTIDGRAFDHTPYLKHGVARFSVGTGAEVDAGGAESGDATSTDSGGSPAVPALSEDHR